MESVAENEPLLSIENLSKSFYMHMADRRIRGCQNITLAVQEGEFVGITGAKRFR